MRKFGFRSIGLALGGLAVAVVTSLTAAAPASATEVGIMEDCSRRYDHQDLSTQTRYVADSQPARSGIDTSCSVRFWGPTQADLHCWQVNSFGSVWWFVQTNRGQGWVFEGHFASTPLRPAEDRCM